MTRLPPLYIMRHGETEWNASGRLQGSFDSALTAQGRAQARAQNQILLGCDLTGFQAISSPQGRAVETAQLALEGLGLTLSMHENLREIGLGDWAGLDRKRLINSHNAVDGFDLYQLAPGGEGFAALQERCTVFLQDLKGPSVLVTHGMTSRMLRLIVTGKPISALQNMAGGQGVVFHLEGGKQNRLKLGA